MISIAEAVKKPRLIDPRLPDAVQDLIEKILNRKFVLTPGNSDDTPDLKRLTLFIENRLAQPHLQYLAPDQANGVWGGSLSLALAELGGRYNLGFVLGEPAVGSDFMRAILDGSRGREKPVPLANSYDWLRYQVEHAPYDQAVKGRYDGRVWETQPMFFNVVGIRGYMVPQGVVENRGNLWNDVIALAWVDLAGVKKTKFFAASVDPGLYYYHTRPINPRGCAHLLSGQYKMQRGPHNGKPAFIQAGSVMVARTNSANYDDRSTVDEDDYPRRVFWINNHPGYEFGAEAVSNSSAGCQVIKSGGYSGWQWVDYYQTLRRNARSWHYYTLLHGSKLKGK